MADIPDGSQNIILWKMWKAMNLILKEIQKSNSKKDVIGIHEPIYFMYISHFIYAQSGSIIKYLLMLK
jgi:hypothetical protein